MQGLLHTNRAQCGADYLQGVRVGFEHLALGVDDGDRVEVGVLRLQAHRLGAQHRAITLVRREDPGAEGQVALRRVDELADARGNLGGIGAIGLQGRMDQRRALHGVGHVQAVAESGQGGEQDEDQDQHP